MEVDIVMLQEVCGEINISGFDSFVNTMDGKRGTAILVKSHIKTSQVQKSYDLRIISLMINDHATLCNVYAPSGCAQKDARERLFSQTIQYYINDGVGKLIVGGDFNSVINRKDANHSSNYSQAFKCFTESLKLCDTWEAVKKNEIDYTFIRNGSGARLDRIYVSKAMKADVVDIKSQNCSFSDHKAVILKIRLPNLGQPFGKGLWRLNDVVLSVDVVAEFRAKWAWWVRQKRYYGSWMSWWIDFAKLKIISFFKWKYSILRKRYHDTTEFYYSALNRLYKEYVSNPLLLPEINKVKGRMLALQKDMTKNMYKNSKTYISGENASIFHVGEKIYNKEKTQVKALEIGGETITDRQVIENEIIRFYTNLYDQQDCVQDTFFNPRNTVDFNLPQNRELMKDITEDELWHAIKTSQSRKSPGCDGLTKNFYVECWEIIKTELLEIANEALRGNLPKKFLDGIIILIRKKGRSDQISNYRPITLLNFDYKLIARIMKNRLATFSNLLISDVQKCSNGTKNIFEATCSIRDKIAETSLKKKTSLLLSFDLEKAFDRTNHNYLFESMAKMGLNANFITFIKTCYNNAFSRILINGKISNPIKIKRSVRQGDPLSMVLFCLYIDPLLQKLKEVCNGEDEIINSYADDISIIINELRKLNIIKEIFEKFELVSGAKVNYGKTRAIKVGINRDFDVPSWVNLEENVKILGVWYQNSNKLMLKKNWNELIQKLRVMLWSNQFRSLNLMQKVIYLNTFASSRIWYLASTIAIDKQCIAKLKNLYSNFLWYRCSLRISFDQMCLPRKRGGLGLISPEYKCKALLITRYLRLKHVSPFFHNFTNHLQNPPNIKEIPINAYFLKIMYLEIPYLPRHIIENPCASVLYDHYIQRIKKPYVEQKYPQFNWNKIWKNLFTIKISSDYQLVWYLLVNEKLPCADKNFRYGRLNTPFCSFCPQVTEDLKHRYSSCSRVRNCWWFSLTQIKLINRQRARNVGFNDFKFPILSVFNKIERKRAITIFLHHIHYVYTTSRDDLDLSELIFRQSLNL